MKTAMVIGNRSDIAAGLTKHLHADGWRVWGWNRDTPSLKQYPIDWELMLIAVGQVTPVGPWMDQNDDEWEECVTSNLLVPVRMLRHFWSRRIPDARVCFLAGSNPQKPMAGYSAYNAGKMALLKVCEQLDFATLDATFFALAPGYMRTKIHPEGRDDFAGRGDGMPIERVYECLKWCLKQPKEVIGGRNICVADPWDQKEFNPDIPFNMQSCWNGADKNLAEALKNDPSLYKLRRDERYVLRQPSLTDW